MQINEYIQKNLSSLNFNVLSSIYEENGSELTEEIKNYLKETPENTNLAILEQLSRNQEGNVLFDGEITLQLDTSTYIIKGIIEGLSFGTDLILTVVWDDDYESESVVWNENQGGYSVGPCIIKPNLDNNYCEIIGMSGTIGTHKMVIIKN